MSKITKVSKSRRNFLSQAATVATLATVSSDLFGQNNNRPTKAKVWTITTPSGAVYNPNILKFETKPLPNLKNAEVLLRTIYLSMEPSLRNSLRLEPGTSPVPINVVM